ncbi:uncharacterized protein DEA37_0002641 [Paragonimus westermani]|uniref:Uncharacterized protein n=1 Tax=Paragonimus westermani TaxID=34504 RepID=A0A5J4NX50_9TREM|nr:uncharacterized protein DEA37_0002641 [Paragonimus westermani]
MFIHLQFNIVYGLSNYQNLQMGDYKYPIWANVIGWALSLTSMLAIPVVAVYQLCITPGTLFERFRILIQPCPSLLVPEEDTVEVDQLRNRSRSSAPEILGISTIPFTITVGRIGSSDPEVNCTVTSMPHSEWSDDVTA